MLQHGGTGPEVSSVQVHAPIRKSKLDETRARAVVGIDESHPDTINIDFLIKRQPVQVLIRYAKNVDSQISSCCGAVDWAVRPAPSQAAVMVTVKMGQKISSAAHNLAVTKRVHNKRRARHSFVKRAASRSGTGSSIARKSTSPRDVRAGSCGMYR